MNQQSSNDVFFIGTIVFLLIVIVFCFYMAIKTSKAKKAAKAKRKNYMKNTNASILEAFPHFNGLPIPEGTMCNVSSQSSKYVFSANGATINLDKCKITDICMETDVEIQKQYVSSACGAIGGALLFGSVGALIGGRTKKKETKQIHTYLIFTYKSDEELKYLAFDVTYSLQGARKFVEEFHKNDVRNNAEINL